MAGGLRVAALSARGFRNLGALDAELGPEVTVVHGSNGVGKTNLLEALYLGLVGRSCRTRRDREVIEFGANLARVEVELLDRGGNGAMSRCSITRDGERRHKVEGEPGSGRRSGRPPVCVFLPDRLAIVKGAPAVRRGHLDGLVAALWPARAEARAGYGRSLAQRNALLGRVRSGMAPEQGIDAWDRELASRGAELTAARAEAVERLAPHFAQRGGELGLPGAAELRYAPRAAPDADALLTELRERRNADLKRGFTTYGPHLDDLDLRLEGRSLRRYGSQGQQRAALLALLLAERELLAMERDEPPLLLLDDVTSELDPERRELLVERLAAAGQALITATERDAVPVTPARAEIELGSERPLRAVA
jgi:DNA replication and repair protein RecF